MTDRMVVALTSIVLIQFLTPRTFSFFDSRLARRRLRPTGASHTTEATQRPATVAPRDDATRCDALARLTRSGVPAREALDTVYGPGHRTPGGQPVIGPLVAAALIDGNFDPAALEVAAASLRDRATCDADVRVALAQASLSARFLTVTPLAGLVVMLMISERFRGIVVSPSMSAIAALGIGINLVGRRWMTALIRRVQREDDVPLASLVDHLCVSLRAGHPISTACERLAVTGECGQSIKTNLAAGESLESSLSPFITFFGAEGQVLADILVSAHRDGQPVVSTVDRLASENRSARRRQNDIRTRELPGKLTAPLVLCVLPSFILLSIAPMVLMSISQIDQSLPPPRSSMGEVPHAPQQ